MSKLVRDNIPDLIKREGGSPEWHVARNDEYWDALVAKLKEEVGEFLETRTEADLVDVMEIIDAIAYAKGEERVRWMRDEKAKVKGTFSKRVILDHE